MSEEATAVQSSEVQSSSGMVEGSRSVDLASTPQPTEQQPPETDKVISGDGQANSDGTPAQPQTDGQAPPAPAPVESIVDPKYTEMLKAKGIDPAKINTPEALNKLLESYSNVVREFTKSRQQEKAQPIQEQPPAPKTEPVKGPLEEFEESYQYMLSAHLAARGVSNMDELWEKDPKAAHYFDAQYTKLRQKAFEEHVRWENSQTARKGEEERKMAQYRSDLSDAENYTNRNLSEARKTFPGLDESFKKHGIDDFLAHLEDQYTIPRTFVLSDPKWSGFFAKAAQALSAMEKIADHDKEVIENYRKSLKKQGDAALPSSVGGGESVVPAPDQSGRGVFWNDNARGVRLDK